MLRRALLTGFLIVFSAAVSLAANLDGRWVGTISTPNGDVQLAFNFKVDGATLTGSVESPNGENPISEGKVNGDKFSFKTHLGDNDIDHQRTVSGDTIQLKLVGPWGESEMKLKRAEKKPAKT